MGNLPLSPPTRKAVELKEQGFNAKRAARELQVSPRSIYRYWATARKQMEVATTDEVVSLLHDTEIDELNRAHEAQLEALKKQFEEQVRRHARREKRLLAHTEGFITFGLDAAEDLLIAGENRQSRQRAKQVIDGIADLLPDLSLDTPKVWYLQQYERGMMLQVYANMEGISRAWVRKRGSSLPHRMHGAAARYGYPRLHGLAHLAEGYFLYLHRDYAGSIAELEKGLLVLTTPYHVNDAHRLLGLDHAYLAEVHRQKFGRDLTYEAHVEASGFHQQQAEVLVLSNEGIPLERGCMTFEGNWRSQIALGDERRAEEYAKLAKDYYKQMLKDGQRRLPREIQMFRTRAYGLWTFGYRPVLDSLDEEDRWVWRLCRKGHFPRYREDVAPFLQD